MHLVIEELLCIFIFSDHKILPFLLKLQDVDNVTLRRFLRARDLDVDKASVQFLKYLRWRKALMPHGSISESDIPNELAHKEVYKQGFDKQGRPIIVYLVANHVSAGRQMDELKRKLSQTTSEILVNYGAFMHIYFLFLI